MVKKKYKPERVRPKDATPEKALELSKSLTLQQIADAWGVSKNRVWQLKQQAKKRAARIGLINS